MIDYITVDEKFINDNWMLRQLEVCMKGRTTMLC